MSEINTTDHKSITAVMFGVRIRKIRRTSLKGFGNIRQKILHCDFFCCIDSCSITRIFIFCCIDSCSITRILQENDVPLLHRAACKEFVSLVQKAFRDSCNRHLVLYEVEPNPSTPCNRQRSSDSSTSDFASPSPEPEDMEVEFPASPPPDPTTRGRLGSFPIEI